MQSGTGKVCMNESHIVGCIASAMQFFVAAYALRLNHRYGTARVGWTLFGAFSLLAMLQLIQATAPSIVNMQATVTINVTYALISFLLLLGMAHLESMLRERLRLERVEKHLRAELELEVKAKTGHLNRAIEELMAEIEQSKRMAAIIESGTANQTADGFATAVFETSRLDRGFSEEEVEALAGVRNGEWLAQF